MKGRASQPRKPQITSVRLAPPPSFLMTRGRRLSRDCRSESWSGIPRIPGELVEGDAERLPFEDAHFDVPLSTYGIMFAPDQEQAAREIVRVVKPGGKIGLSKPDLQGVRHAR